MKKSILISSGILLVLGVYKLTRDMISSIKEISNINFDDLEI